MNRRGFLRGAIGLVAVSLVPTSLFASGYKKPVINQALKGNSFEADFTAKLAKAFLERFEAQRVLSKALNCHSLRAFNNDTVTFRRPLPYKVDQQ